MRSLLLVMLAAMTALMLEIVDRPGSSRRLGEALS